MDLPDNVHVLPQTIAVQALMDRLRNTFTESDQFRATALRLGRLVASSAVDEQPCEDGVIRTPVEETRGLRFTKSVALVPILRAGNALVDPFCELLPNPRVWHVGMSRDHETHRPSVYMNAIPKRDIGGMTCFILDPMFATGGSAVEAVRLLRERGAKSIVFAGIVGAPEGVAHFQEACPDVPVYLAVLDRCLNENAYILPGLGDFGDRYYNSF
ncbi:MAG: uracil phosphoribosyltransferase [Candidatus Uhrbacteria bacterium]